MINENLTPILLAKSSVHSVATSHNKLLTFLENSIEYRAERILAQLPKDGKQC
jgi:hypothetical protein